MSEKFINTSSLIKSALSIMQRDAFVQIINILTGVIVARSLGPEILGIWVILSLISAYAESFGRLKTDISSVYFLSSGKAKQEEVLFSTTLFALLSSLIIVLLTLWQIEFIQELLFKKSELDFTTELTLIILLIPFEFLLLNYSYFFISLENVKSFNKIKVLQAILNFSLIILLIFYFNLTLWALVIARMLSTLITLGYSWNNINRSGWIKLSDRWNLSITKKILSYALNFYLIGIIGSINRLTIRSLSALSLNFSQLAFYNQGEAASRLMNIIPNSVEVILYPNISKLEEKDAALEIACVSFRVTLLALIIVGMTLFLIANPLIIFLYGIEFEKTAEVLKIAIPGIIVGSSCLSIKSFFEGKGQANLIPKLQIIPVILQILIAYFLINSYGLIGAAVSFSLGSALYGIVIFVAFIKINKLSFFRVIPQIGDIKLIYNISVQKVVNKKWQ